MTNEEIINGLYEIKNWKCDGDAKMYSIVCGAIKLLEQTKWIPCSERSPEESGDYLVTTKWKGSYSGDVYTETVMAMYRAKSKDWDCADVIAWMPSLPEPYKKEGE